MATGGPHDRSPIGTPGGRQNWVDKVGGLPGYIREIAHALMRQGHSESKAIRLAIGTVKNWASGQGNVSAATRAKAAAAVAEWEAKKAASHARRGGAKLSRPSGGSVSTATVDLSIPAAARRKAQSEGKTMADGSFPIRNRSDLVKAIHLAGNAKDPAKARAWICKRAKALGMEGLIPDSWSRTKDYSTTNPDAVIDVADLDLSRPVDLSRLVKRANSIEDPAQRAAARAQVLDLAARWRHGWIPVNAEAMAIARKGGPGRRVAGRTRTGKVRAPKAAPSFKSAGTRESKASALAATDRARGQKKEQAFKDRNVGGGPGKVTHAQAAQHGGHTVEVTRANGKRDVGQFTEDMALGGGKTGEFTFFSHTTHGGVSATSVKAIHGQTEAAKAHDAKHAAMVQKVKDYNAMTPEQKIANAEKMFGTGSPQHKEAQRRFGQSEPDLSLRRADGSEITGKLPKKGKPHHQPGAKVEFKTARVMGTGEVVRADGPNHVVVRSDNPAHGERRVHKSFVKPRAEEQTFEQRQAEATGEFVVPRGRNTEIRGGAEARANLRRARDEDKVRAREQELAARQRQKAQPLSEAQRFYGGVREPGNEGPTPEQAASMNAAAMKRLSDAQLRTIIANPKASNGTIAAARAELLRRAKKG